MPAYNSGIVQVCIVGLLAFLGPGLFNALNGLGAVGSGDQTTAAITNGTLYFTFAIFGYFAAVPFNLFGPKPLFVIGGFSYAFYCLCVYYTTPDRLWVAALGGLVLGMGAGLFWTAQGALMMAYSTEAERGLFVTIFWAIFNLGGVMGGLLQFGLNFNTTGGSANDASYFTFIALMTFGALISYPAILNPNKVVRSDGTIPMINQEPMGACDEIKAAAAAIQDHFVLKMFVFFFFSNWFYTYHFNFMNAYIFNTRTRGLNSALYWAAQMIGALIIGSMADRCGSTMRKRGLNAGILNGAVLIVAWIIAICQQYLIMEGNLDKALCNETVMNQLHLEDYYFVYRPVYKYDGQDDNPFYADNFRFQNFTSVSFKSLTNSGIMLEPESDALFDSGYLTYVNERYASEVGPFELDYANHGECTYTRVQLDFLDDGKEAGFPMFTYALMGFSDAMYQAYVYWFMGAVAGDDVGRTIRYSAAYKGIQSLGAGIAWSTDLGTWFNYRTQAIVNLFLACIALVGGFISLRDLPDVQLPLEGAAVSVATNSSVEKDKAVVSNSSSTSDNE